MTFLSGSEKGYDFSVSEDTIHAFPFLAFHTATLFDYRMPNNNYRNKKRTNGGLLC